MNPTFVCTHQKNIRFVDETLYYIYPFAPLEIKVLGEWQKPSPYGVTSSLKWILSRKTEENCPMQYQYVKEHARNRVRTRFNIHLKKIGGSSAALIGESDQVFVMEFFHNLSDYWFAMSQK